MVFCHPNCQAAETCRKIAFFVFYFPQGLCDPWAVLGKRWAATFVFKPKAKVYIVQVGSRNNFRLAGWNLVSSCT